MTLILGVALTSCLGGVPPEPSSQAEAAAEYEAGITAYETRDYAGAIEAFTRAFELAAEIEDEDKRATAMNRLRFNLARAHVGAFGIEQDPKHLRTAESLLVDYRKQERRQGRNPDADVDLHRLEQELENALDAIEPAAAAAEGPEPAPGPSVDLDEPAPERRRGRIIAGGTLLGLGAASLGVMGYSLARGSALKQEYLDDPTASGRSSLADQGRQWNVIAGVTGGVGGALAIGGAALLVTGLRPGKGRARVDATASRTSFVLGVKGSF